MSDLHLNKNFEVEINSSGDLKTVSGNERVKQSVAMHVTDAMYDGIGEVENQRQFLRLSVNRALRTHSLLEEVSELTIEKTDSGQYFVDVSFGTSSFSFEVTE